MDFLDAIGVNGWPVEAHVAGNVDFRLARGSRGFNQIPYRMLLPLNQENLLVAGRCASMTHDGQSSARVSGPCFVMGQAAGTAAGQPCQAAAAHPGSPACPLGLPSAPPRVFFLWLACRFPLGPVVSSEWLTR